MEVAQANQRSDDADEEMVPGYARALKVRREERRAREIGELSKMGMSTHWSSNGSPLTPRKAQRKERRQPWEARWQRGIGPRLRCGGPEELELEDSEDENIQSDRS